MMLGPEGRDGAGVAGMATRKPNREQQGEHQGRHKVTAQDLAQPPRLLSNLNRSARWSNTPAHPDEGRRGWPPWRRRVEGARHRPGFDHRAQRLGAERPRCPSAITGPKTFAARQVAKGAHQPDEVKRRHDQVPPGWRSWRASPSP